MKKLLLFILVSFAAFSISAANYFVQSGAVGATTWDPAVVSANSGILVDLTEEGKTFNIWYADTFTAAAAELTTIYVVKGNYTFTDRFLLQDKIHIFGGYNGTSLNRTVGNYPWEFPDETIFNGNNCTSRLFYTNGVRNSLFIDGITLANAGGTAGAPISIRTGAVIRNCKLINNQNNSTSSANGAAIYFYGGGSVLNSYFEGNKNNHSSGLGGDIGATNTGTTIVIDGCMFVNSYAVYRGSVLAVTTNGTTINFSNNLIINPIGSAAIVLSATATAKPVVNMINNTFVNNTVPSVHVFANNGSPSLKIYNCVFWSPSTLEGGLGRVSGTGDETIIIKNCALLENPPTSWTSENNILLENVNTGELSDAKYPDFVNPDNNDYRLTASSALRNAGAVFADVPNTKDFFGLDRPQGSKPDIGFAEFDETRTGSNTINTSAIKAYAKNGKLVVENNEDIAILVNVFEISGKLLYQKQLNAGEKDGFNTLVGSYIIRINTANGVNNSKVIVP